jgi:DNA-binding NarL/FixJ family response regulator
MKRLLLIDDHAVVRDGVKRLLADRPDEVKFGEAGNAADALRLTQEDSWDVAVLDISIGGRGGLELLREMKQLRPKLPVVILTMHSEEQYAKRAFQAGASGYVTKDTPREELLKAINRVLDGGKYVSPSLAEKLVLGIGGPGEPAHDALSGREFQVLRLIASGESVREIADALCLSDKTVSTYRARILEKMGLKSNAELIHYAMRNKLIE